MLLSRAEFCFNMVARKFVEKAWTVIGFNKTGHHATLQIQQFSNTFMLDNRKMFRDNCRGKSQSPQSKNQVSTTGPEDIKEESVPHVLEFVCTVRLRHESRCVVHGTHVFTSHHTIAAVWNSYQYGYNPNRLLQMSRPPRQLPCGVIVPFVAPMLTSNFGHRPALQVFRRFHNRPRGIIRNFFDIHNLQESDITTLTATLLGYLDSVSASVWLS